MLKWVKWTCTLKVCSSKFQSEQLFTTSAFCVPVLGINGRKSLSCNTSRYLLVAEREYWMNWVCVLSWNGELDVGMFGGCWACWVFLLFDYSILLINYYKAVKYSSLLNTTVEDRSDNFLRSSDKLGLKGAVLSHAHTHFCSSAYMGCLGQKGPQNTRSSCCHTWS